MDFETLLYEVDDGVATLTLNQAAELGRYGITSNAIAPSARASASSCVEVR